MVVVPSMLAVLGMLAVLAALSIMLLSQCVILAALWTCYIILLYLTIVLPLIMLWYTSSLYPSCCSIYQHATAIYLVLATSCCFNVSSLFSPSKWLYYYQHSPNICCLAGQTSTYTLQHSSPCHTSRFQTFLPPWLWLGHAWIVFLYITWRTAFRAP